MTTVLVPLPTSRSTHYLSAKIGLARIQFELIRLARIPSENGLGSKFTVGDRMNLDLAKLRRRRVDAGKKRPRGGMDLDVPGTDAEEQQESSSG